MRKFVYRSAITGKFVTREYAMRNPNTTIRQEVGEKQRNEFLERIKARAKDAMEERAKYEK